MRIRSGSIAFLIGCLAALSTGGPAAVAQMAGATAPNVRPGMVVKHTSGANIGTVKSVEGDSVIVTFGPQEVRLPASSFTPYQGELLFALTREQLQAQLAAAQAKAAQQVVPGALVRGSAGQGVGTIEKIEPGYITLKLMSGKLVRLPESAIAPGGNAPVIGMTAAQLEAAAAAGA